MRRTNRLHRGGGLWGTEGRDATSRHRPVERVGEDEQANDERPCEELTAGKEVEGSDAGAERPDDGDDVGADANANEQPGNRCQYTSCDAARRVREPTHNR